MKIELTPLQAKEIMQALREKWQATRDAFWLGLLHNLEDQITPKPKNPNQATIIFLNAHNK